MAESKKKPSDLDVAKRKSESAQEEARKTLIHYFALRLSMSADMSNEVGGIVEHIVEAATARAEARMLEKLGVSSWVEVSELLNAAKRARGGR